MKFPWLTDPSTKKPSVTLSVFVYGFIVATTKLLISGISIMDKIKMSDFTGVDYAAAITALGATYVARRSTVLNSNNTDKTDP